MFGPKIKIDKELYERVRGAAEKAGYTSVDEFIVHVLEREAEKLENLSSDEQEAEQQLRGLGYLE